MFDFLFSLPYLEFIIVTVHMDVQTRLRVSEAASTHVTIQMAGF